MKAASSLRKISVRKKPVIARPMVDQAQVAKLSERDSLRVVDLLENPPVCIGHNAFKRGPMRPYACGDVHIEGGKVNRERASIFSFRKVDNALLSHHQPLCERSFTDRPKTRLVIRMVCDQRNAFGEVSKLIGA